MSSVTINLSKDSPWYEQFTYPAGETQVRFRPEKWNYVVESDEVSIIANITSAQDIMALVLLNNALTQQSVQYRRLVLPYLPYSRADRAFRDGDCCGLAAFGQILGSMLFDEVITLDVHNRERAQFFIPFLIDKSPELLIAKAIAAFARRHHSDKITVLFPDEGARTRYQIDPKLFECNVARINIDVKHCEKNRNSLTGALEGFTVPETDPFTPAIIIDDICDGGGTFIGIAKELDRDNLGLYVTHGIFSKGFGELNTYFDHIYTTDSFSEKGPTALVTVFPCLPTLLES